MHEDGNRNIIRVDHTWATFTQATDNESMHARTDWRQFYSLIYLIIYFVSGLHACIDEDNKKRHRASITIRQVKLG